MSKIRRKEGLELKKSSGYLLMAPTIIAVLALSVYHSFSEVFIWDFLNYNLMRSNDPPFNTFAGLQNYIEKYF